LRGRGQKKRTQLRIDDYVTFIDKQLNKGVSYDQAKANWITTHTKQYVAFRLGAMHPEEAIEATLTKYGIKYADIRNSLKDVDFVRDEEDREDNSDESDGDGGYQEPKQGRRARIRAAKQRETENLEVAEGIKTCKHKASCPTFGALENECETCCRVKYCGGRECFHGDYCYFSDVEHNKEKPCIWVAGKGKLTHMQYHLKKQVDTTKCGIRNVGRVVQREAPGDAPAQQPLQQVQVYPGHTVKGCCHAKDCPLVVKKMIGTDYAKECNVKCDGHHCVHWASCVPRFVLVETPNVVNNHPIPSGVKPHMPQSGPVQTGVVDAAPRVDQNGRAVAPVVNNLPVIPATITGILRSEAPELKTLDRARENFRGRVATKPEREQGFCFRGEKCSGFWKTKAGEERQCTLRHACPNPHEAGKRCFSLSCNLVHATAQAAVDKNALSATSGVAAPIVNEGPGVFPAVPAVLCSNAGRICKMSGRDWGNCRVMAGMVTTAAHIVREAAEEGDGYFRVCFPTCASVVNIKDVHFDGVENACFKVPPGFDTVTRVRMAKPAQIAAYTRMQADVAIVGYFQKSTGGESGEMKISSGRILSDGKHNASTTGMVCGTPLMVHVGNGSYVAVGVHHARIDGTGVNLFEPYSEAFYRYVHNSDPAVPLN
jgi:hypothetical protein